MRAVWISRRNRWPPCCRSCKVTIEFYAAERGERSRVEFRVRFLFRGGRKIFGRSSLHFFILYRARAKRCVDDPRSITTTRKKYYFARSKILVWTRALIRLCQELTGRLPLFPPLCNTPLYLFTVLSDVSYVIEICFRCSGYAGTAGIPFLPFCLSDSLFPSWKRLYDTSAP